MNCRAQSIHVSLVFYLLLLFCRTSSAQEDDLLYAVAQGPTPVLNTPEFAAVFGGADGRTLKEDKTGLIRELEWIAFSGTVFEINDIYDYGEYRIYKVVSAEYPYRSESGYFIDSRFVDIRSASPDPRKIIVPSQATIIQNLRENEDIDLYVWGGNISDGVPSLLELYPPQGELDPVTRKRWQLQGLDCSGLLFEATNGYTPRNTSALVNFGEPVHIKGLSAAQIADTLQPLDIIAWAGHVIIVIDSFQAIESRARYFSREKDDKSGVLIRDLYQVILETMRSRCPVNNFDHTARHKQFVVRRWYKTADPKPN
jgi:hypothetical protein